jgi:hypothetical protein
MTHDGTTAVAADPDRDALYVVDVTSMAVRSTILLKTGDEPGRLAEDGAGHVHIALRGGHALVTIDPTTGALLARRSVCPAPRGVAWDATSDSVWVACATGELVQLPAGGGSATRSLHVERDLRDVIIQNGALSVTSFRSANILRLASDGSITRRDTPKTGQSGVLPQVAWRTIASPSGSLVMVHQLESTDSVSTGTPGGYGGGGGPPLPPPSGGPPGFSDDASEIFVGDAALEVSPLASFFSSSIVTSALTEVTAEGVIGTSIGQRRISGVLPVDVAIGPDGTTMAGVTPGSSFTRGLATFFVVTNAGTVVERDYSLGANDQPIAVAFSASGNVILQTREPAKLWMVPVAAGVAGSNITSALLSAERRDDTGHDVFHTQAGGGIACASCHPEGGDDGHVWNLDNKDRRTPSLRGTIAGTAPYHWPGDQKDLPTLVHNVYTLRMSGVELPGDQMGALTGWVQTIPAPPAPSWVDPKAASAGRTVFNSSAAQCSSCHSGAKLTNNQTVDVGTGGPFQVPPLVGVGWRTPLLHGGCASTIADRFGSACSTKGHGDISKLSSQDIANLTAFLETL